MREYSETPLAKQLALIAQAVDRTIKSKASITGREPTESSLLIFRIDISRRGGSRAPRIFVHSRGVVPVYPIAGEA